LIATWQHLNNKNLKGLLKLTNLKNPNALAQLTLSGTTGDFQLIVHNPATNKIKNTRLHNDKNYLAPLNGRVIAINISEGDSVVAGQEIIVLEAMKMEHILKARTKGKIKILKVKLDAQVTADQLLFQIEND